MRGHVPEITVLSRLTTGLHGLSLTQGVAHGDARSADLLHGVKAIAEFLGVRPRRVNTLIDTHGLRVFKMGHGICARKSSIKAWIEERERAGAKSVGDMEDR